MIISEKEDEEDRLWRVEREDEKGLGKVEKVELDD